MEASDISSLTSPVWSLQTPGDLVGRLFSNREDFFFGMNLVAICAAMFPGIRILTFTLVRNRLLFLMAGERADIEAYFRAYRKRLKRYLADRFRYPDLARLEPGLQQIPDVPALRQEIIRINRTGAAGRSRRPTYPFLYRP